MARHGTRLDFFDMPPTVLAAIESALGACVVTAVSAAGGFSPGPAATCELDDDRVVFVKACGDSIHPLTTALHRREATVLSQLPSDFPAPELLDAVEADDWFALITEHVAGEMPVSPFSRSTLDSVLELVATLAEYGGRTQISVAEPVGSSELERSNRWAWKRIADERLDGGLDDWSRRHLAELTALEDDWIDAATGSSLLHRDLRTDNMIIGTDRAVAVDWPTASIGAAWIDLLGLLPALRLDGGPEPAAVFATHPVGADAEPAAVDCYLAALAGYFTRQALLPPVPGIESVRSFQAAQGEITRAWLRSRVAWD